MTALDTIIKQANQSLVDLTCKTFLIDQSCATIFRPVVTDLIAKKFFVEVSEWRLGSLLRFTYERSAENYECRFKVVKQSRGSRLIT